MAKKKKTMQLELVTPEGVILDRKVEIIEAPAIDGLIGIWPRHAPLVTVLDIGVMDLTIGEEQLSVVVGDGIMEVKPDQVNIVVRQAVLPEDIELNEAEQELEEAEAALEELGEEASAEKIDKKIKFAQAKIKAVEQNSRI